MYKVTIIGSSHGNLVGALIDGVPPGFKLSENEIQLQLDRRRPGQSRIGTKRNESDRLNIETGVLDGITTGDPILAYVQNEDKISRHYDDLMDTPRPGHADYPARVKYKEYNDHRGGGRFSGRLTVGLVIAGDIARQLLGDTSILVQSYTQSIGEVQAEVKDLSDEFIYAKENFTRTCDPSSLSKQIEYIEALRKEGDSCGGIVATKITGLPVGVGEPWFDSFESVISHMMFSIPAVKGVEFGAGFKSTTMRGSAHNDLFYKEDGEVMTRTNNSGGILGGMTTGMPVEFRTAFKPASSIRVPQLTLNTRTGDLEELRVKGRHDPCVVPRAVPVVRGATYCIIYDLMRRGGLL